MGTITMMRVKIQLDKFFFKIQITLIGQIFPENKQAEKILEYSAVENRPH